MATSCPVDAVVVATQDQLESITAIVGPQNVQKAVVGENNIVAFWNEGPRILAQLSDAFTEAEQARIKTWDELHPDVQHTVISLAAGTIDWAEDATLNDYYIQDVLKSDPEFRAALLRPESHHLA